MPRKATSPAEFEQMARVRTLLREFRFFPSPELRVTTATGKAYSGRLVRDHVGNNAGRGGRWTCYGAIVLRTGAGNIEIDYLDIVWIEPNPPENAAEPQSADAAPCGSPKGSGMLSH